VLHLSSPPQRFGLVVSQSQGHRHTHHGITGGIGQNRADPYPPFGVRTRS
jgi:hypothetical protein